MTESSKTLSNVLSILLPGGKNQTTQTPSPPPPTLISIAYVVLRHKRNQCPKAKDIKKKLQKESVLLHNKSTTSRKTALHIPSTFVWTTGKGPFSTSINQYTHVLFYQEFEANSFPPELQANSCQELFLAAHFWSRLHVVYNTHRHSGSHESFQDCFHRLL